MLAEPLPSEGPIALRLDLRALEEMPLLQQAFERYGDQVAFQGVNAADTRSTAVPFTGDLGVTYPRVVDSDQELLTGLAADGRVVDRQIGEMPTARLEELVIGLAASAPTP
jgi:cytochrome c biogenesis protein CcmG/thiol:disulfide interchange protein DsbE